MLIKKLSVLFAIVTLLVMGFSCSDEDKKGNPPTVSITSPENGAVFTTQDTITFIGAAADEGDGVLTGGSLVWISNIDGNIGTGETFRRTLSEGSHRINLKATDSDGDTSSAEVIITVEAAIMTVIFDGHSYRVVRIGTQLWFAENLRTTVYRDGSPIPHVTDSSTWGSLSTDAYSEYDNDPASVETYGRLYNWYAVEDERGLCPSGWRVATDSDWTALNRFFDDNAASRLAGGFDLWVEGDMRDNPAFGETGFTALPGGYRYRGGYFDGLGINARFWTSTEYSATGAWGYVINNESTDLRRLHYSKRSGFSVRCIKE